MKRALAFLVFGPVLAAVTALLVTAQAGRPDHDFAKIFAIAVFFFTLPVSAITGCIDGVLSDVPIALRAALTAAAGALVALGLAFVLFSWLFPPAVWLYFAFGGATCMGACSLLASELGERGPAGHANSLLRN
jgi:mannose/fructose/N-acetylgalactosamine-specific phosphotransferase system component IIC